MRSVLTKNERDWLEYRKILCNRCASRNYCKIGKKSGYTKTACGRWNVGVVRKDGTLGRIVHYLHDALVFEALVAKELACMSDDCGPLDKLRQARIAAEEIKEAMRG